MRTFFRRLDEGQIELRDWESLTALLTIMTLRKCQRQHRRFANEIRDVLIETSDRDAPPSSGVIIPDRSPSPDEVAAFSDLIEQMLARIPPRDGEMVKLLLTGETVDEIARRFRRSRRTVQRTFQRIRQILTRDELFCVR
jgi:DNA-directed RNA polymerase specialized sigma24 family protein